MSVFVVAEYTRAEQNSTGYFWETAVEQLRQGELDVEVITLERPVRATLRRNILVRAVVKALVAVRLTVGVLRRVRDRDIVLSGTNPEMLFLLMVLVKKLKGFRWYVLVHDVFPENLVPAGVTTPRSAFYRVLKSIFDRVYSKPDKLFVIGRDMQELVAQKAGNRGRTEFIFNWVDSQGIQPVAKSDSEIISELGWQDKVVFQFFGNIGRLQGIANLLSAIDLVSAGNAAFLFMGEGVEVSRVVDYQRDNPTKNVHYYGPVPLSLKEKGLAACDVAVIALAPGMYGLGVPSKAYFSMAADRPLLAIMDEGSEIALMVEEEQLGWTCAANDSREIAAKIDEICRMDLSEYAGRPRELALSKYSKDVALARLSHAVTH